ncbi:cysteine protease ATG4B-like [Zingiber officinale]|uniref:cysteine protease ATG4B-like n=1 Tax=Zingiber officinale TaxID=94328 RepID=UPI001C4C093F|nr:cysteine protease ATG4B-like [Zingiber officinale]
MAPVFSSAAGRHPPTPLLIASFSSLSESPPLSPKFVAKQSRPPLLVAKQSRPLLFAKQSRLPLSPKLVAKQSRPPLLVAKQSRLPLSPKLVEKQSRPPLLVAFLSCRDTPLSPPYDLRYLEILHLFGDSSSCAFSIHNLLEAGKAYGLVAGSWLGPYDMCRTWETIINTSKEQYDHEKRKQSFLMVLYIVSGDKDGEQGGAPVVCIEVAARLCHDFNKGQQDWAPILLLVPLVLGLEKINPRNIPLLWETFTFPQCLGILGGKPGASTYIVGVQDEKALYLDPHEAQSKYDILFSFLKSESCLCLIYLVGDTK